MEDNFLGMIAEKNKKKMMKEEDDMMHEKGECANMMYGKMHMKGKKPTLADAINK